MRTSRGKLRFRGRLRSDERGPAHGADHHAADGEHGHEQAAGHAEAKLRMEKMILTNRREHTEAGWERAVGREAAGIR